MITDKDYVDNGGKYGIHKKWSRKKFYILNLHFDYLGRQPTKEDFIEKVNIKCIGVLMKKGKFPSYYKCKNSSRYFHNRDESKIFLDIDEIKKNDFLEDHLKRFNLECMKNLIKRNIYHKNSIKNTKKLVKENNEKIKVLESLEFKSELLGE